MGPIELAKKNVLVGVYYRPPGSSLHLLDKLDESLALIPPIVPTILCGDFNAASIDWDVYSIVLWTSSINQDYVTLCRTIPCIS